jgi:hypothetical protein
LLPFVIDAALVGICAWHGFGHSLGARTGGDWFAPLVLILLFWLLPAILRGFRWTAWLCDRLVLAGGWRWWPWPCRSTGPCALWMCCCLPRRWDRRMVSFLTAC